MLENVGEVVAARLAHDGYQGAAEDVESYLYESMVEPSAYVVPGFGKAGSNDTVSPMPNVSTGSVGLGEADAALVRIHWPDGGEGPWQRLEAGEFYLIERGSFEATVWE